MLFDPTVHFLLISGIPVIYVTWTLLHLFRQRSLFRIPGPRSVSIITGNQAQWCGLGAIPFQEDACDRYGSVFRLNGFLGVRGVVIPRLMYCANFDCI